MGKTEIDLYIGDLLSEIEDLTIRCKSLEEDVAHWRARCAKLIRTDPFDWTEGDTDLKE